MITVIFYGLDQFVVGRLSRELTSSLAKLYEVKDDEVNFIAPNNMVFHNGVEQTSWNILIHVHAPMQTSLVQEQVAKFLLESIGDIAINKAIEFYYYSKDNRYEKLNPEYPRFLSDDNLVDVDEQDYYDKDEGEDDDEIYTDDIFKDFHGNNDGE